MVRDHRPEVPEVRRVDRDFRGDHDLPLVRRRLRVVALHPPARGLDVARVGIGQVDLARRRVRWLIGLRWPAEAAPVLHHATRPVGLVFGVRSPLDGEVLFEPALGFNEALGARTGHRPCFLGAPVVKPPPGVPQPPLSALTRRELRRQLIATPLAEPLVLERVDLGGLFEDLARDLLVIARRMLRRVRVHLRAVHRDHRDTDQPGLRAQRQHLAEQAGQRVLMALTKPRDRAVIRHPVGRDHAIRDVAAALAAFDELDIDEAA
jgi:hypothetical protein